MFLQSIGDLKNHDPEFDEKLKFQIMELGPAVPKQIKQ